MTVAMSLISCLWADTGYSFGVPFVSTGVPQPGQDSDKETGSMLFCTTVNLSSAAESSPETLFDPKAVINLGAAVVAAPYDSVGVVGCCDCSCIVSCMSLLLACLHVVLAGCHHVIVSGVPLGCCQSLCSCCWHCHDWHCCPLCCWLLNMSGCNKRLVAAGFHLSANERMITNNRHIFLLFTYMFLFWHRLYVMLKKDV